MKTDDLVRWAIKDKNGINKINGKNWIHSPESLVNGHVAYLVKVCCWHSNALEERWRVVYNWLATVI